MGSNHSGKDIRWESKKEGQKGGKRNDRLERMQGKKTSERNRSLDERKENEKKKK